MNVNTKEYWNEQWVAKGVKKFPIYTMNRIFWLIPENVSVLDVGCGNGKFLNRLKNEKNCEVFGIDISDGAIKQAKEKGIEGEAWNAENLNDFSKTFDVVVAAHIFEHIEDDENLARNIARITKQFAVIAVPNNCSFPEETGEHVRKYTLESLTNLLKKHFSLVQNYTLRNHLILRCLK